MTLHVAVKILSSENFCIEHEYAKLLLTNFVDNCVPLYGPSFVVSNLHGLIHVADDVKRYGALDNYSAFKFENYLGILTRLIQKNNNALQQVVKRIYKISTLPETHSSSQIFNLRVPHCLGPLIEHEVERVVNQYMLLDFKTFFFSTTRPDNCVILHDNRICLINNIIESAGTVSIIARAFGKIEDLYHVPIDSSCLDIFKVSNLQSTLLEIEIKFIKTKMYLMPLD